MTWLPVSESRRKIWSLVLHSAEAGVAEAIVEAWEWEATASVGVWVVEVLEAAVHQVEDQVVGDQEVEGLGVEAPVEEVPVVVVEDNVSILDIMRNSN
jgi:hypothetical protein